MRFFVNACLLLLIACSPLQAGSVGSVIGPSNSPNPVTAKNPVTRGSAWRPFAIPFSVSPLGQDSKRTPLPTRVPAKVKRTSIPNLDAFFVQIDRYNEIKAKSIAIEGWVYMRDIGPFTDDYEEALHRIEFSESCLDEALYRLVSGEQFSLLPDPGIELAKSELAKAEHIIDLLCELANLEI